MSLSSQSQKLLDEYFSLPFKGMPGVRTPYFNNARQKQRGQLRVLVGKGKPQEIVDEAQIISIQYHAGIFDKNGHCCLHGTHNNERANTDEIRKFLIDHNLGVECSGFVTQILRAHFKEAKNIDIAQHFTIVSSKHFLRWCLTKLRPVENISVRTWMRSENTTTVSEWTKCQTGDVVIMLESGPNKKHDHILLILNNDGKIIEYAHARAWVSEGKNGHGVTKGQIKIIDLNKGILGQRWEESGKEGEKNETWVEAKSAKLLEIRRIKF
ncbi:MAG: hypothetical protein Q7S24_01990 [bacterium]|nr:hypothetical protein [bacterium]